MNAYIILLSIVLSLTSVRAHELSGPIRDSILVDSSPRRVVWDATDPNFASKLIKAKEPVILVGSSLPTKTWKAMDWSLDNLDSDAVLGVKKYHKPKLTIGCCKLEPVPIRSFFQYVQEAKTKNEYVYLNAPVSMLGEKLSTQIGDLFVPGTEPVRVGVWMGSAGSTAPLHHDPFDNFFVQIHGRKRFILFHPFESTRLYLYPKTGPRNRQSQVDIDGVWSEELLVKFPELPKARGIVFEVGPGDVLFLPPFWFHQVESLDDSISLNVWYKSAAVEKMDEAWDEGLPLLDDWTTAQLLVALKEMVLRFVLATIAPEANLTSGDRTDALAFLADLARSRFQPLFGDATGKVDHLKGIDTSEDPHLLVHLREQRELDANRFILPSALENLSPAEFRDICSSKSAKALLASSSDLEKHFSDAASAIANHFIPAPDELMWIHLEDFVEDFVGQALGDEFVYTFLQNCVLTPEDGKLKDEL